MHPQSIIGLVCLAAVTIGCTHKHSENNDPPSTGVKLVENGRSCSRIALPDTADAKLRELADDMAARIAQSTKAKIPVVKESEAAEGKLVNIFLGDTRAAQALKLNAALPEESYRIVVKQDAVYLLGKPPVNPPPTEAPSDPLRWAVNALLEEGIGIRYLWPGELGTFVPARDSVVLAEKDDIRQPQLKARILRMALPAKDAKPQETRKEAIRWAQNHQSGRRGSIQFGHAFTNWWKKYAGTHPDYFAPRPEGLSDEEFKSVIGANGQYVKLRLSNPEVIGQIAEEYQQAGAPDYYNICPNDGMGHDTSPETLAWDDPQTRDLQAVWKGETNLTARYVRFWNLVSERLRQINPNVTVETYAYSCYRYPPKETHPLTGSTLIGIVDGWDAFDSWSGWRQAGAGIYLRPNWGFCTAGAPVIYADEIARFMSFAHKNGMVGFDLDTILGHWGSEGFNYYVMARLQAQPDLTADDIAKEYSEAFGSAAPKIREYLAYWQDKGKEFGYAKPAGGTTGPNPGRYHDLQEQRVISDNYYHGPYEALPHLYTDAVLTPAKKLLEEAKALLKENETEAAERVAFLQAGLTHHELMRDALALGMRIKAGSTDQKDQEKFRDAAKKLDDFRKETPFRHLVWDSIPRNENRYKAPIRPKNIPFALQDTLTVD